MTDPILQCNALLFQGLAIGFVICLVVILIIIHRFYRKYVIEKKHLKGQLVKAKNDTLSAKNAYQLLLDKQQ